LHGTVRLNDRVRLVRNKTAQECESVLKNGALANQRLQPTRSARCARSACGWTAGRY